MNINGLTKLFGIELLQYFDKCKTQLAHFKYISSKIYISMIN